MDLFENKEFLAAFDELSKVSDVFVDHVNKKSGWTAGKITLR